MGSSSLSKSKIPVSFGRSLRCSPRQSRLFREPAAYPSLLLPPTQPSPLFALLKDHQKRGVLWALKLSGCFLAFDQRTGKTWVAGEIIHRRNELDVLLIGLKTNLRSTWVKFFKEHLPRYKLFLTWEEYKTFRKGDGKTQAILMLNYEAVGNVIAKVKKLGFGLCVIDEVQRLKSRSSASSRYARRLRDIPFRVALSGTPMDDSPNDMWAIMRFVEPRALSLQWKDYAGFFTKPHGYMGKKRLFKDNLHDLYIGRIKPFVYRVTKEEAGILRASVKYVKVEMTPKQRRMYDELEQDMMLDANGTLITTPLKITQIGKLQQITGGFIIDEEGEVHRVGDAKERMLKKYLWDIDGPFVVFCKYSHEVEACYKIAARMFDRVEVLTGKVKDKRYKRKPDDLARTNLLARFQRGEVDGLIAQQRTGGVGVDMYKARKAFVYSNTHSFIDFDQMISRLDFMDAEDQAEFLVLYVPRSIDEDIRVAIRTKTKTTKHTLNRLRKQKELSHVQRQKNRPEQEFTRRQSRSRRVLQVRR